MNTVDVLKRQEQLLREVDFLAKEHTQNERNNQTKNNMNTSSK